MQLVSYAESKAIQGDFLTSQPTGNYVDALLPSIIAPNDHEAVRHYLAWLGIESRGQGIEPIL